MAMHTRTVKTCTDTGGAKSTMQNVSVRQLDMGAMIVATRAPRRTHQCGNSNLESTHRVPANGVPYCEQEEDVGGGDDHPSPDLEFWEEHAERHRGPQELREVCADDSNL